MARETGGVGPKVGKYSVDVGGFEKVAIPSIEVAKKASEATRTYVVIDEVGRQLFNLSAFLRLRQISPDEHIFDEE